MSPPTYIYKIVPASSAPPDPLPDRLPVSNLDATDGFIHLSTAKQVARTLDRYFNAPGNERIYLLRLDYANIKGRIKWETPQGVEGEEGEEACFPHLYNGNKLGKNEVESVASVDKAQGQNWEQALASIVPNGWLSY